MNPISRREGEKTQKRRKGAVPGAEEVVRTAALPLPAG